MLQRKKIAVLGGDARYLELIKSLTSSDDLDILLVGFDQLNPGFSAVKQVSMNELEPTELSAVILPLSGVDEFGNVETVFSNKQITLKVDWINKLPETCTVFTGITTPFLKENVAARNLKFIPLMNRNDIAIYNSIPTAEGAIMLTIKHTNITIQHANVFLLGLGRVGTTCVQKFKALGANVWSVSKNKEDLARADVMGVTPLPLEQLSAHIHAADIVINTIPAKVLTKKEIQLMGSQAVILDLASKPGGTDFSFAKARGVEAIHALGLPGIVAPKTSGEILANAIKEML
ncbi:dipicolinic acid synthetase subunit A [Saliterribacillus persicus]|nr:dipicolinic acid synthetase subunit A [Saliterribacillus persicus]